MSSETCVSQGFLGSNWNKIQQSHLICYLLFPDCFPDDAENHWKIWDLIKCPGKKGQWNMFVNNTNKCNVNFVYISIVLFVQEQVYLY